jgi:prolyl oligopeptidase
MMGVLIASAFGQGGAPAARDAKGDMRDSNAAPSYPVAKKVDQVDDYHGTKVADLYRWLEDPDAPDTRAWIEAENKVTFSFLGAIPERRAIRDRLTALWNYERFGVPFRKGDRYFVFRNDGLQNQSVLYTMASPDAEPKVLLDPNALSPDGTVALATYSVSEDGRLLAYGLSKSGSDWTELRVRDVAAGRDLPDVVEWVKFSNAAWAPDGKGFFYGRYDAPDEKASLQQVNYYHKLYYHRLGTPQSADALVYERPDRKEWGFGPVVTEDGRYLVVVVWRGTEQKNLIFYKDLREKDAKMVELIPEFEATYAFVGNDGPVFFFRTDAGAPRGRLVAVDTRAAGAAARREIVPESRDTLEAVTLVNDGFVASYLEDARTRVRVFGLDGRPVREVALPGIGSAGGFDGRRTDRETFYYFTSFTHPTTVYRYDLATGESRVFRRPDVDFDPSDFEVEQVFYASKDGTRVPMFLAHKKGLRLDGANPTYLYGYGGFAVPMTPAFSVANLVWMEMGGVYAQPCLRGGAEYGEAWHEAGTKLKKQNVFDDFVAAAEWLVANKYTSPAKLAIGGGSNGGLLVGAVMTQRPELFGAAVPEVGVMDMLRFHKFTIGWAWASDYGSSDDPEEFKALYAYSPLHNLKPGTAYPATLVMTADHDDRVVPAHSFKFAAALQAAQGGPAPVLIRIETKAGHGAGKPTAKLIDEAADRWAFLARVLGARAR